MRGSLPSSLALSGLIFLIFCFPLAAQKSAVLLNRLHEAAETTTLDAPGSNPFHLKLSVEIYPQYGRTADKGTLEMWWNSPKQHRIVYDLTQYHATIVQTDSGLLREANAEGSPYIVDHMLAQILHPVSDQIDASDYDLTVTRQPFGKIYLECIFFTPSHAKSYDLSGNTYCFDEQSQLRVSVANPDQYNLRQKVGTLGAVHVPLSLQYSFLNKEVANAQVITLQSQKRPYQEAFDTLNLVAVPTPPTPVPGQNLKGHILHQASPLYPDEAKQKRIAGTVLLHGIIATDGKVKTLSLIGSPDDSLTKSALEAVKKWVYEPYLLNGVPTEVDTTITVNYTFGTR